MRDGLTPSNARPISPIVKHEEHSIVEEWEFHAVAIQDIPDFGGIRVVRYGAGS